MDVMSNVKYFRHDAIKSVVSGTTYNYSLLTMILHS